MSSYRKVPVVIEAQQFDGTWESVNDWLESLGYPLDDDGTEGGPACWIGVKAAGEREGCLYIDTLEGTMRAEPGDFIIRGVQGEFYPCKPEIFAATYEAVADRV